MRRQRTGQILLSILWGIPIALILPIYVGFRLSFWLDQFLRLPIPFPEPANILIAIILWLVFFPLYISSAYYLIKYGGGSPNPYHASPVNLVTNGPYRYIRHPMNLTYPFLILGVATFLNSFTATFIMTPFFALVFWFHALVLQEKELIRQFGDKYERYKNKTPSFIPKL